MLHYVNKLAPVFKPIIMQIEGGVENSLYEQEKI